MTETQAAGIELAKRTARSHAIARRDAIPQEIREQKSAWICERLASVLDQLLAKDLGSSHPLAESSQPSVVSSSQLTGGSRQLTGGSRQLTGGSRQLTGGSRQLTGNSRQPAATVAVYAAMRSEADPSAFARYAEESGCTVAYPCMLDPRKSAACAQRMCMRAVRRRDLGNAPFIAHPARPFASDAIDSSLFPIIPVHEIDLIVVPIVAFDGRNMRLGYGGGCYDRYLPALRADCQVTGIAFDEQRLAAVPTGPHDQALPRIISA